MDASVLILSGAVAGLMAWAIGAQDVSNALGTSVGSKALTVRQAIVAGALCEFLGSLAGGEVAGMISSGILHVDQFQSEAGLALYARLMFCTMAGAFSWLSVATYFGLPVSTTHSLVGSLVGVGVLARGWGAVRVRALFTIVASWVTSPVMGGVIAYGIFWVIHARILRHPMPRKAALQLLPYFVGSTVGVLAAFLFLTGPAAIRIAPAVAFVVSCVVAAAFGAATRARLMDVHRAELASMVQPTDGGDAVFTHLSRKRADPGLDEARSAGPASPVEQAQLLSPTTHLPGPARPRGRALEVERAERMFLGLMVLTACVVAFAHGSNDVSNSIGPFTAVVSVYFDGRIGAGKPPFWVLLCGGIGIVLGLATYGYKVMATVGEKITKLTFTRGYAAQIGTALTVLTATQLGLSVSTTHCLIGAISGVALVESRDNINITTLQRIAASWVITIPAAATFAAIIFGAMALLAPLGVVNGQ